MGKKCTPGAKQKWPGRRGIPSSSSSSSYSSEEEDEDEDVSSEEYSSEEEDPHAFFPPTPGPISSTPTLSFPVTPRHHL